MIKNKIISFEELSLIKEKHPGKKIVHCHGVFDLIHYGHMLHLQSALEFGDILVVTLTKDQFVNKGPGRPYFSEQQRLFMMASMACVHYVALNTDPQAMSAIDQLKPDCYVKGPDYRNRQNDITGGIFQEEEAVKKHGGKIVFTSDEQLSSTSILNEHFANWSDEQKKVIDQLKNELGLEEILKIIDSLQKKKVLVVGEPIIDRYIFCQSKGISSKSPTVSALIEREENYAGGSLAIARHLNAIGCSVTLLITSGGEDFLEPLYNNLIKEGVNLEVVETPGIPTPLKTRYLQEFKAQRMFELMDIKNDQWKKHDPQTFIGKMLKFSNESEVVVLADFGHGMFEGKVLESLKEIKSFKGLNVQANSANFGFNVFTKHENYDYLSIDERECRLATHDSESHFQEIIEEKLKNMIKGNASFTLGVGGSVYIDHKKENHYCPIFFKDTVDTTGAGDAYFAITSVLSYMKVNPLLIPFIGNCFAGLKTKIIGNKSAVSRIDLIRTVKSILN